MSILLLKPACKDYIWGGNRLTKVRAASRSVGKELTIDEIFEGAEAGNIDMIECIEQYTLMLGHGVVNIVNMFRPQLILIGGRMSPHVDKILPPVRKMVREDCFGGINGLVPEITAARLGDFACMIGAASL